MKRLNFDQRCAFKRLVRLNSGYGRKFTLADLKSLRITAMSNVRAGMFPGYAS
jgi:hypothetical protein